MMLRPEPPWQPLPTRSQGLVTFVDCTKGAATNALTFKAFSLVTLSVTAGLRVTLTTSATGMRIKLLTASHAWTVPVTGTTSFQLSVPP